MKTRALLREVARNLATETTRALTFGLCLALVAGALCMADLGAVRDILTSEHQYRASGADVTILTAAGRIDGAACDQLAKVSGVVAAGAIRNSQTQLSPRVLPNAPIPISEVTPGFGALVDAPKGAGVALGPEASQALGVWPGTRVATATGTVSISGQFPFPDDGRIGALSYSALVPSITSKPYDECWVKQWPQSDEVQLLLLLSMTPSAKQSSDGSANGASISSSASASDQPPSFAQLNPTRGNRFAGLATFMSRVTQWSPIAAALAALGLGYVSIRSRRLQLAAALHAGVKRIDQLLMATAEAGTWIIGGLTIAFLVPAFVATGTAAPDSGAIVALGGAILAAAGTGGLLGTVIATLCTHEKHLFRYFKDR